MSRTSPEFLEACQFPDYSLCLLSSHFRYRPDPLSHSQLFPSHTLSLPGQLFVLSLLLVSDLKNLPQPQVFLWVPDPYSNSLPEKISQQIQFDMSQTEELIEEKRVFVDS